MENRRYRGGMYVRKDVGDIRFDNCHILLLTGDSEPSMTS